MMGPPEVAATRAHCAAADSSGARTGAPCHGNESLRRSRVVPVERSMSAWKGRPGRYRRGAARALRAPRIPGSGPPVTLRPRSSPCSARRTGRSSAFRQHRRALSNAADRATELRCEQSRSVYRSGAPAARPRRVRRGVRCRRGHASPARECRTRARGAHDGNDGRAPRAGAAGNATGMLRKTAPIASRNPPASNSHPSATREAPWIRRSCRPTHRVRTRSARAHLPIPPRCHVAPARIATPVRP